MIKNMLSTSILLFFVLLFSSCDEESIQLEDPVTDETCGEPVQVDYETYANDSSDFYVINSAYIIDDCLAVAFSSSGCSGESWEVEMVGAELPYLIWPPQYGLKLMLENPELCDAVITDTAHFDLTGIQTEHTNEYMLRIDGFDSMLRYQYGEDEKCEEIIMDAEKYENASGDFVIDAVVYGDCLEITYAASACSGDSWEVELVDSGQILESLPPQKRLRLLIENKEECEAYITKTTYFDLTEIRLEDYHEILLNIHGLKESISYTYGPSTCDTINSKNLMGGWDLVNVSGGFTGIDIDFESGDIAWQIYESIVVIENNKPELNDQYGGFISGVYDYELVKSNEVYHLVVNEQNLGVVSMWADSLSVDQRAADGFLMKFKKRSSNTDVLNGRWNLVEVTCECPYTIFEKGEHVWTFDTSSEKLNVINKLFSSLQILDNGEYELSLSENSVNILSIEYDYYFENGELFLADNPEVDGPLLRFVRD